MTINDITIELVILGLFLLCALFQLWYYIGIFGRVAFYKRKVTPGELQPTSVIICTRNEERNLVNHLPVILQQEYPQFEVIVVNDCSYDNTADVLDEFSKKFNNLRVITIKEDENHYHGKKFALMVGIKGALHEHLLLTDADCKPNGKFWLRNMMQHMQQDKTIVLGYGAYEKTPGFLNKVIRYDTFYIALQYLGFGLAKRPYMGVGRNLAYTKTAFFNNKGFASHYHIASGDDDLFINEVANKKNTTVEIDEESITVSKVKPTLKLWIRQKRRHITTFKFYKSGTQARLVTLGLSQYFFYILFVVLLIMQYEVYVILGVFLFRIIVQMVIFSGATKRLKEKDLLILAPVLELIIMFFYPLLGFTNLFIRKSKWIN